MYGAVCSNGTGSRIFGTASFVPQISIKISGTVADKSADGFKQRAALRNILQAVEAESGTYEKRDYGTAFHQKIAEKRKQAEQKLIRAGFTGTYPEYHRGEFEVIILEEHPFTVMEWDHFQFRIYYMVSQVNRQTTIGKNCHRQARNRGFFRGRGRNSWIFTEDGKNVADRIRKKM